MQRGAPCSLKTYVVRSLVVGHMSILEALPCCARREWTRIAGELRSAARVSMRSLRAFGCPDSGIRHALRCASTRSTAAPP